MTLRSRLRNGIALGLLALMVGLAFSSCCCLKREGERDQRPSVYRGGQYYGDAVHQ